MKIRITLEADGQSFSYQALLTPPRVRQPADSPEKKKKVRDDVPVVPFDVDLMNWGQEVKARKVLRQTDAHRFWGSGLAGIDDGDEVTVPGSTSRERTIDFSGKFEPVKWSCRAPLPSGT